MTVLGFSNGPLRRKDKNGREASRPYGLVALQAKVARNLFVAE